MERYYIYILESERDHSYYVGYTQGLEKRVTDHNEGRGRYSSRKTPWKLVHSETYNSKREAIIRERQIKKWKSKKLIQQLIDNTEW